MTYNRADLESIHRFSDHHRELLARSERAGCFYCRRMYDPREITEWIDGPQFESAGGVTALCPRCGIDAVLPSAMPVPLTAELLAEMHSQWFQPRQGAISTCGITYVEAAERSEHPVPCQHPVSFVQHLEPV
ncbi:MAG TPA: hypothetical protein VFZ21_09300 [Gemmatimonadaceae bacterium]|nr:hypothetical protein [Gemmatimonadaceae bacterium]